MSYGRSLGVAVSGQPIGDYKASMGFGDERLSF